MRVWKNVTRLPTEDYPNPLETWETKLMDHSLCVLKGNGRYIMVEQGKWYVSCPTLAINYIPLPDNCVTADDAKGMAIQWIKKHFHFWYIFCDAAMFQDKLGDVQ